MKAKKLGFALALPAALVVAAALSCSKSPTGLASDCTINSDCDAPLVCVFSHCHEACAETRDCPVGERCVSAGQYDVCTLPSEEMCGTAGSSCPTGLTCAPDDECRNACQTSQQCLPGQACQSNACFETATADASTDGSSGEAGAPEAGPGDSAGPDGKTKDSASSVDSSMDVAPSDAGPLGYAPSNFVPSSVPSEGGTGLDFTNAPAAVISTSCTSTSTGCLPVAPVTIAQSSGMFADVYVLKSLTIASTAALTLMGPNPIIFVVSGAVDVEGNLLANGHGAGDGAYAGPGGYFPGAQSGRGAGGVGCLGAPTTENSGSGGAGYCGAGGSGGAGTPPAAIGGMTYGSADLVPLWGGSAGGACESTVAGPGGGALQVSSATSITVGFAGAINAGGGGGQEGTGGGSGGAILLEAPTVTINGILAANGGGGGQSYENTLGPPGADGEAGQTPAPGGNDGQHSGIGGNGSAASTINGGNATGSTVNPTYGGGGGGGAGRIRINTPGGSAAIGSSAIVSPSLTTACATQGKIRPSTS